MDFFKTLFRSKKSPEHALQELVTDLKSALAEKLRSVIVFGSHASDEFQEGKSTVNVMVLTSLLDSETLNALAGPVRSWMDSGHESPVLLRIDEFAAMSRVLPIEFLDMVDHHRIVFGVDPFQELSLDADRLTFQVEHDLNTLLLKLRRFAVQAGSDQKTLTQMMARSIPSAFTLCRALLRLQGPTGPLPKAEAARRLSPLAGFDAGLVDALDSFRRTPAPSATEKLFSSYLEWVEKLLHYARQRATS